MELTSRKSVLNLAPNAKSWYRIENKADSTAEVWIYNEISMWGITADDFVDELQKLDATGITCHINCKGGDVFDGIAIFRALRSHKATVTTVVDSIAASIASVIAQGGDVRVMNKHSQMMIHEASSIQYGDAAAMREMADLLDRQSDVIAGIYADRSGKSAEDFRASMKSETWYTDQEAVDAGLADEIRDVDKEEPKNEVVPEVKNNQETDFSTLFEAPDGILTDLLYW